MKIVFLNYYFTDGYHDPHKWLDRISPSRGIMEALAENHDVTSIEQISYEGQIDFNRVQYLFVRAKDWKVCALHKKIKALDPDVVVVHSFLFPVQTILLRWQLGNKAKIIVQNHAERPARKQKFFQRIADKFIDRYLFTAKQMGEEWVNAGIISNTSKIKEVMEASSFFQPADKTIARSQTGCDGNPVFLWVGRFDSNKDPITVARGFLKFAKQHPQARLYMIYQSDELLPEIRKLPGQNSNPKAIVLVGRIIHSEMEHWYNSADFLISGSRYEGSGIAVAEAMSCSCIPVLTNILSFQKLTGYGDCGFLYNAGDYDDLATVLDKAISVNQSEERKKVIKQFREHLSFNAIAKDITAAIDSIH